MVKYRVDLLGGVLALGCSGQRGHDGQRQCKKHCQALKSGGEVLESSHHVWYHSALVLLLLLPAISFTSLAQAG